MLKMKTNKTIALHNTGYKTSLVEDAEDENEQNNYPS